MIVIRKGRKPMPPEERKQQAHVYLKPALLEWLIKQGNGDLSQGIAIIAECIKRGEQTEQPLNN